mgnify:CR=1 FL=1
MSFLDVENYPEFKLLQDNCEILCIGLKQAKTWLEWYSDTWDAEGNCVFLKGDWTVSPVYFGNTSPEEVLTLKSNSRSEWTHLFGLLPGIYPEMHALLRQIPSINYAGFSKLGPRTQLATHQHKNPDSLIAHVGLQIPRHCSLTVGDVEHVWRRQGEIVIFDDTQPHSASNFSNGERIVFYVDFKKPQEEKISPSQPITQMNR